MSFSNVLKQIRGKASSEKKKEVPEVWERPKIVTTNYTSLPVSIPSDFLAPLEEPSTISVSKIDFAKSQLPAYEKLYAVIIDNVLSAQECQDLLYMAEQSTGAHGNGPTESVENNGWRPAMVNAGLNREFLATDYRNSDRIIWDNKEIARRLWQRVLQGKGMKEYFEVLEGEEYHPVIGQGSVMWKDKWTPSEEGLNERLRFLKYSPGQFFKEHCDGTYQTPDGTYRSLYTLHLYLNDSAQALGIPESDAKNSENPADDLLRGGATPFLSMKTNKKLDVDPKAGRVLIFQQKGLLHSGDLVTSGIKYTMRSDLMYKVTPGEPDSDDNATFG